MFQQSVAALRLAARSPSPERSILYPMSMTEVFEVVAGLGVPGLGVERQGSIAILRLDRPDKGNSLTSEMHTEIRRVWSWIRADPDIRATIITGSGDRHFCTGTDVSAVAERGTTNAADAPLEESVFWSSRQNRVWKPTICAVNGIAAGGGLHFVVDSDVVVAADTASFLDTHVNVGMVGAVENIGLMQRLPLGTVLRMTLQGKSYRLNAERAYQLGLVDELVAPESLFDTAMTIAKEISRNSPEAVARSMEALWSSLGVPYDDALEHGWSLARGHWGHPDFVEGPRAFVERRAPNWQVLPVSEV
jgi:E-phenylitaconyl-CoA hydratase